MKFISIDEYAKRQKKYKYATARIRAYAALKFLKEGVDFIRDTKKIEVIKVREDLKL